MVPDDVRDQRAVRVQIETPQPPAPRVDAVHLPELPRLGYLRPARVKGLYTVPNFIEDETKLLGQGESGQTPVPLRAAPLPLASQLCQSLQ